MACAGNPNEICGGGNRILIYQDVLWALPTIATFANEDLQALIDALVDLRGSILAWQAAVDDYRSFLLSGGQKRRRQDSQQSKVDTISGKWETVKSKACKSSTAPPIPSLFIDSSPNS
jgi:hypothetical protein